MNNVSILGTIALREKDTVLGEHEMVALDGDTRPSTHLPVPHATGLV